MKLYTYLNYGGNCREAFEFYAKHLGGRIMMMSTFAEMPGGTPPGLPPEWKDKVVHARIAVGDTILMGADIPPNVYQPMRSAYMTLMPDSNEEAERIYDLLRDGGTIFMKMEETFYAHRFAQLRDRFGTSWMLLRDKEMR
jgi:PhnB protein